MTNALGFRKRFGVIAPSTNTIVQAELDAMRSRGVTNHHAPILVRDRLIKGDEDFLEYLDDVRAGISAALELVMTCHPDHLVLGLSAATFWDGLESSKRLEEEYGARAGIGVTIGSDAVCAALRKVAGIERLGIITPFMPVADQHVRKFFVDSGYEVITLMSLRCQSLLRAAADVTEAELRDAIDELDDPQIQAIVQLGSNLAMARIAAMAEFWLDIPVIAINTATYRRALRHNGIEDKVYGFGAPLEAF